MINEERFWESAIGEAVRSDSLPDVTARVLAGLSEPAPAAAPATTPRGKLRFLRIFAEVAVAAVVVFAIGWLTGVLRVPEPTENMGSKPVDVAAAPGTDYEFSNGNIELQQGWLLVVTGTPSVHCGGSVLEQVDGRVLVHASGVPTREQAEAVLGWLSANGLEQDMIIDTKRWAAGTMLAALVLSGSALLDGERIQAQEEVKTEAGKWLTVRTVMDIDKLPADAKLVRGEGVSGAHLEFLATHESIESIDFRGCADLRSPHLVALSKLKNLRTLELRGARWDGKPDYSPFMETSVKELAVDYVPQPMHYEADWLSPAVWNEDYTRTRPLALMSQRGVVITLGNLDGVTGKELASITIHIETLRELNLSGNVHINDADMRAIAEHKALQKLDIEDCSKITELGLAYLAKENRLSSLRLDPEMSDAILYQLSRMTNLESLEAPRGSSQFGFGSDENISQRTREALEQISSLPKLKHLLWSLPDGVMAADYAPLAKLKSLTSLILDGWGGTELMFMEIAAVVPVATIEFEGGASLISDNDWQDDEGYVSRIGKLAQNKTLVEVHLNLLTTSLPTVAEDGGMLPVLLAKASALRRIRLQVSDASAAEFFRLYANKHLAKYEVEIVVSAN